MSNDQHVARRKVLITNALGFHMRPASKFARVVNRFQSEVRVYFNDRAYDGRSILDLTCLAAERGSHVEVEATGPDADAAVSALQELIGFDFYEDCDGNELPNSPFYIPPQPSNGKEPTRESPS